MVKSDDSLKEKDNEKKENDKEIHTTNIKESPEQNQMESNVINPIEEESKKKEVKAEKANQ